LRNLIGLPPNDGFVITPSTAPLTAPIIIDVAAATSTALTNRPDVVRQASMVRTRECEVLVARNAALPQLDLLGLNRWNGVGGYWTDSLSQMTSTEFVDYQASLTLTAPIGLRAGAATLRAAVLQLEREKALMKQAIHSANHQVSSLAQEASYSLQLFTEADSRRKLTAEWLAGARIRFENPPPAGDDGDWLLVALNDYLAAMRSQSEANVDSQTLLARYNVALAKLSEATGTILNEFDIQAEPVE
jgi:outer membrane protein TolC